MTLQLEQARTAYKLSIATALRTAVRLVYDAKEATESVRHDIELDSIDELQLMPVIGLTDAIGSLEKLRDMHPVIDPKLDQGLASIEQMHQAMGQY